MSNNNVRTTTDFRASLSKAASFCDKVYVRFVKVATRLLAQLTNNRPMIELAEAHPWIAVHRGLLRKKIVFFKVTPLIAFTDHLWQLTFIEIMRLPCTSKDKEIKRAFQALLPRPRVEKAK